LEFERLAVHLRRPFQWNDPAAFTTRLAVSTSTDGREYKPLAELTTHGLNRTEVLDLPHAAAAFVRVTVEDMSDGDSYFPLELGELELLRTGESPAWAPSIPFVLEKTGGVKAAHEEDVYQAAPDDTRAVPPREVVLLSERMAADGRLRWNAPAGNWAILRFGYTSTGAMNAPATREGRGLECDKMDPAAVEHHFHSFPEKLITEAGEHAGKTLRFVFVDSWEAGFQNWTGRFADEFQKRRGYSLLPWLPALTGEAVGSSRESEAVLYDFRRTIADLIRESYYERLAELLHQRGIEFHAEVIYGGGGYPPLDILRSTQQVDLPMYEYWTSADKDSLLRYSPAEAPELNLPACAVAGYGKPLLGSEAYTGFAHYSESPADLKPFGDRAFCAGINRMILHSSVHQPTDERPGMTLGQFASHFNRNNLYWNHAASWLEYQARIQSLLGQGTPVFDVLYYLGDQLPQYLVKNAGTALPPGYALDAVNADILATRVGVVDGHLRLNGQGEAALLSLPPQPWLSLETLKRLEALVREGAQVYGPRPLHTLSVADAREAAAFRVLADRVFGDLDGRTVFHHAYGKGGVSWGKPIGEVLAALEAQPQFAASPAGERDFLFTHRRAGDSDVFFVTNQQDRTLFRECSFRVGEKTPEVWDPETGAVTRPALFRLEDGRVRLPVRFAAHQALLFVFRPGRPAAFVTRVARGGTTLFPSAGGSEAYLPQLQFEADGVSVVPAASGALSFEMSDGRTLSGEFKAPETLPIAGLRGTLELRGEAVTAKARFAIADLRPLNEYDDPQVRYFSGEATYRLSFSVPDAPAASGDRLSLDLGDFESVAEVALNGQPLGVAWKPGTALDVTDRLRRDNELVVTVTNVYRNRLIGDLAQYGELRNLKTSSPIKDFLAADKPLKRSGLFGPLQVVRVRRQRVDGP
ncbi:MAG TPA: glycosyl hydrolase, partial [Vicinamibacteria bacterium]|nr:glycosyl hydrolase [Vicinamibacteria bacterium]